VFYIVHHLILSSVDQGPNLLGALHFNEFGEVLFVHENMQHLIKQSHTLRAKKLNQARYKFSSCRLF
jgi:predicted amino acid racemase